MTVEKAMQLIQQDLHDPGSVNIIDLNEAHRMAYHGLARLQEYRQQWLVNPARLLPGETERRTNEQT